MLLQPQIVGSGASAGGALKSERKMKSAKKSIRGLVESVGVGICTLPFFFGGYCRCFSFSFERKGCETTLK